jgi:hypothetical protein
MKWLCLFFALIISFLVIQPVVSGLSEENATECCGGACSEADDAEDNGKDNCLENLCNPFLNCCCSIGCCINEFINLSAPLEVSSAIVSFYVKPAYSHFIHVFLRPPNQGLVN